jgi:Protein of unknown function (DUF2934)
MENDRETKIRQRAYQLWQDEGCPEGKHEDHWAKAAREIDSGDGEIEGDDVADRGAMREAVRDHSDTFIVTSDLEDADQRESSPGTREQR